MTVDAVVNVLAITDAAFLIVCDAFGDDEDNEDGDDDDDNGDEGASA